MAETFQSCEFLETYITAAPSDQNAVNLFRGGWSSRFPDAHPELSAGNTPLFSDDRIQWMINALGGVKGFNVLELGPLEGAHAHMMEKAGAESVQAIEASTLAYLKCLITKEITGLSRTRFQLGNFVEYLRLAKERFDLILASGVLYHLTHPVETIRFMSGLTDRLFIWTHYFDPEMEAEMITADYFTDQGNFLHCDFEYKLYRLEYEQYLPSMKYRGGLRPYTHWMNREDLMKSLTHFGYTDIKVGMETREHPFGPNITLLATRDV